MDVTIKETPAKKTLKGNTIITIPAGKTIKIEISPSGEEILNYTFPEGQDWTGWLSIRAEEKDT